MGTTSFDPVIQFEYIESEFISSFANANGTTFLHDSSLYGYYEIVNWLLSNTSVQLTYDYSGYTAVFYAVETNNLKILKLLLKYFPFGVEQRDEVSFFSQSLFPLSYLFFFSFVRMISSSEMELH